MRLVPVIARLQTQCPALLYVGGAANYAAAADDLLQDLPAAYVIPLGDVDGSSEVWGEVHQARITRFAVVIAISNLETADGSAEVDAVQDLRQQIRDALLNWLPPECDLPVEAAGGKLLDFDNSVLWWQDDYTAGTHIRSV